MRQRFSWPVLMIAMLSAAPARATVLVPADLGELAREAASIVRGRVSSLRVEWADGRRRVVTIVTLDVREAYKGGLGPTVSFGVPGGTLGRYRTVMVGAPTFREGDDVVVFLNASPPALPHLVGFGQGVYRVLLDRRTGETRVVPPALVAEQGGTIPVTRGSSTRRSVSIEEFAGQIRQALSGPGMADRKPDAIRRERGKG